MNDIIRHYDLMIDENNDPVHDPKPLKDYMDKWDGQEFIDSLELTKKKSVLEIGVGTGRLAVKTAPLCGIFHGIDISPKTVDRAKKNLRKNKNVTLICADFTEYQDGTVYDVIYSSLTFMHIENKQTAIDKVYSKLKAGGRFVLSIDKNQSSCIDTGTSKITVFPDSPEAIKENLANAGFNLSNQIETEFAHIFVADKKV